MPDSHGGAASVLRTLRLTVDRARTPAAFAAVAILVVDLYFGFLLGPLKGYLFPGAVGLLAFFMIQELVQISQALGIGSDDRTFSSIVDAKRELSTFVAGLGSGALTIKILAATGGTTVGLVDGLCDVSKATHIAISLHTVNELGPLRDVYPNHWCDEVQEVRRHAIDMFGAAPFDLVVTSYDHLPAIHGIMINDAYLVFAFFGWQKHRNEIQLSGAKRPHRIARASREQDKVFFDVFNDWFTHAPQQRRYPAP